MSKDKKILILLVKLENGNIHELILNEWQLKFLNDMLPQLFKDGVMELNDKAINNIDDLINKVQK